MPRVKLDKLVDKPKHPVKTSTSVKEPTIEAPLSPAIVTPSSPVNQTLKKLAGTPFLIDVDTGLVYLEPNILKSLKNN